MREMVTVEAFYISFPANHPALADHFVGRPLVPGALLLSAIHAQLVELVGRPLCATSKLRFNHAVLPKQSVMVQCKQKTANEWRFRGTVDDQTVIKGIFHSDSPVRPKSEQ